VVGVLSAEDACQSRTVSMGQSGVTDAPDSTHRHPCTPFVG
jgi:hypothetical protein